MSCASEEYEVVHTNQKDEGAIAGISIISVIIVGFIITFFVVKFNTSGEKTVTGQMYNTVFDRLGGFFGGSVGQFSISMLVAILVSNVVGAFNGLIITPFVQVAIPDQKVFTTGIDLGRNVWFYPGQFFLSLFGFIISIFILFFLTEGFYQVSKLPNTKMFLKYFFIAIVILMVLGILAWNIYVEVVPQTTITCMPVSGANAGGALGPAPPITPMRTFINGKGGIRFSI